MSSQWNSIALDDLGVLRLRGPDAVRFLQGQVSNDVERLTLERSLLAGYHNPQGRALAVLRLVQLAPDDLLAILPRELAATVASRLGKFVLRAKVKISEESGAWRVAGLVAPYVVPEHGAGANGAAGRAGVGPAVAGGGREGIGQQAETRGVAASPAETSAGVGQAGETRGSAETSGGASEDELGQRAASRETDEAFEARAQSWAASLFQQASAQVAEAGERSAAAVQLEDSDSVVELPTVSALMLPDAVNGASVEDGTVIIRVGASPARWMVVSPVSSGGEAGALFQCTVGSREGWRLLDIADGVPQVYAATSEEFVAQMLNLDAVGGISFEKGCYTGQEVIARAHYRGRVKRRMQRFLSREATQLLRIGESGVLADGRSFKVVEAAQLANGRCEFLAVAPMVAGAAADEAASAGAVGVAPGAGAAGVDAGGAAPIVGAGAVATVAGVGAEAGGPPPSAAASAAATIDAEPLPLSYALPE